MDLLVCILCKRILSSSNKHFVDKYLFALKQITLRPTPLLLSTELREVLDVLVSTM